jgi:hypothetical protein
MAPCRITITACESSVRNTPGLDVPLANVIGALPDSGTWFDGASAGGGDTHRYGGGGAAPSSRGRRARGLRCPLSAAAAR